MSTPRPKTRAQAPKTRAQAKARQGKARQQKKKGFDGRLWGKRLGLAALGAALLGVIGFFIAWQFYIRRPDIPENLAKQHDLLYRFLLNKWYFDELYDMIFVRPAIRLGRLLWKGGDGYIIDGLGPDGVSARVLDVTRNVVRLQSGYLYHYAFAMLIGAAAIITWFMFSVH